MDEEKDYEKWNNLKENLDAKAEDKLPSFKKRQIWWTHIGVNVGSEILGKGDSFSRPVLIIKVYRYPNCAFLAAPLTSTESKHKRHVTVNFKERQSTVLLDQMRTLDARRLIKQSLGRLDKEQFEKVMAVLREDL